MEASHLHHMVNSKSVPVPTPAELAEVHTLTPAAAQAVIRTRQDVTRCLTGEDKRLVVIVGPCSEDDSVQPDGTPSVVRYAQELKKLAEDKAINEHLLVIMRCNPAKPRSDLGLAGLEQKDPVAAHKLLTDISNLEVPLAIEVMNSDHLARYGQLLSLAWIGARNIAETHLRHALSAYSQLPVLCKNGERGELKPALQAIKTINSSHKNARITLSDGRPAHVEETGGNPHTGLIWRGGTDYADPQGFERGLQATADTNLPYGVDCAHDNERAHDPAGKYEKSVEAQKICIDHLLQLIQDGKLSNNPKAILIESYLLEGLDTSQQTPGQSWTDPCIGLEDSITLIQRLAKLHATL
jgi:3-deoxy-7-phosphoheptulonate synthase